MLEVERNQPVDMHALTEFFARFGWEEPAAATKLEWAMAAADQWVVCKLDGDLVGFGRSCRLSPLHRVVFDVLVDPRFNASLLRAEIIRLLVSSARGFERVLIFGSMAKPAIQAPPSALHLFGPLYVPAVSADTYLGGPKVGGGAS